MLKKLKEVYLFGLRNVDEFFIQVIYIGVIINEILILKFLHLNANIYTIMLLIHVISMYILGYKKDCWEYSKKEQVYQKIYFVINISALIVVFIITKTAITIMVFFIPIIVTTILSIFFIFVTNILCYLLVKEDVKIMIIMYAIIMLLFAIPILIIPIKTIYRITIALIYYISIPFISCGTDNGMNFYTFFNNTYNE